MAVTLEQAKLNTQDDIQKGVIDEFRKSSYILDNIQFDDAVTPGTSGGTLTYGYTRVLAESGADFRKINQEYANSEATKKRFVTELKPLGGSFNIDRIVANTGGLVDEFQFQLAQKVKAARALFHDTVINGSVAENEDSFDGLDVAVTGSSTEYHTDGIIDLSTSSAIDSNYKVFLDEFENWLAELDEKPSVIAGNSKLIARIKQVARRSSYLTQSEDAFGRKVSAYDGIPLVDLGAKAGSNNPVVKIETRTVGDSVTGLTDIYAVRFGMDAFHGVSLANQDLVTYFLPDFSTPGAVKTGEVEMVTSVVLKKQKSAGVFRNVKVQ
ncbi:major capsid protein [Evansella tamaricis]|uniref:Phage capsid protein n=1 Tax=Evansella tamaricis TaxID=2069301 RepID=A0ABS6JPX6_9BACI|nr:phage capsid protein [Evansella tamaricis]MBU9714425.1 phage capsid protein [Evansella tamaricis]